MSTFEVVLTHPIATLPSRANPTDAGLDLTSIEQVTIAPGKRALVDTGIKVKIPDGHYLRIAPRSGLAVKNGIQVGAGVVDQGYTGLVKVLLFNHGDTTFTVEPGMRIAQAILEKISLATPLLVDSIEDTSRGTGGFGSTGH